LGNLTDDDLDRVAGSRDQLEGIIQERYGIAKDQVRKDIDTWLSSAEDVIPALCRKLLSLEYANEKRPREAASCCKDCHFRPTRSAVGIGMLSSKCPPRARIR